MNCPIQHCGSDDVKKARMVYLTSTTLTTAKGTSSSLSLASGGVTIGGGTSHSKSKAQLMLAFEESIQPPKPPPSDIAVLLTSLGIAAFLALALMAWLKLQDGAWFYWFFTPIGAVLAPLFYWGSLGAWDRHRELDRLYNKTWICLRCGHTWRVED